MYRQRRSEKYFKRAYEKHFKKKEPQPKKEPKKITLSPEDAMSLYFYLVKAGLITQEELAKRCLNDNNPFKKVEVEIDPKLSKGDARRFWVQLIKNNHLYCELCGNPIYETSIRGNGFWSLTAEHRHPKSKGGQDKAHNLGPAHKVCNELKGNVLPEEWEVIGLAKLLEAGIPVNLDKVRYDYLRVLRENPAVRQYLRDSRQNQH